MLIASRQLKVRAADHDIGLEIRVFKPTNDDGSWTCKYEIDWPKGTKKSYGKGVDAIQALLLTLQKVGIELYTSEYHKNSTLHWPEQGDGHGFPVPKSVRDLLIGHDLSL